MEEVRESTAGGIVHPEWVNGRRIWTDSAGVAGIVHKLQHGDPTKGWEGDPRLAVWWNQPDSRWEIWRLEHDEQYRFVCRSAPGIPFDERVIDALISWDRRRHTRDLHDEVVDANAAITAERQRQHNDYMELEAAPRLAHALRKEAGW